MSYLGQGQGYTACRRLVLLCLAAFCMLLVLPAAQAEVYRWVDAQGRVHFGDAPRDASVQAEQVEIRVQTIQTVKVEYLPEWVLKETRSKPNNKVVMYSTQWCGVCKKAKRYMKKNNIPFQEKDIDASDEARKEFRDLGGRGVPLILVGNRKMSGFSKSRFKKMYEAG